MSAMTSLDNAIRASENYLISVYNGYWSDFLLMPGPSNLWISSLVVTVSAKTRDQVLQAFRQDAFAKLDSYAVRNGCRIGYNEFTPCDCDSSIWLARAYASLNKEIPKDLLSYISAHIETASGQLSTYILSDEIDQFIGVLPSQLDGWFGSHSCVTANYLSLIHELNDAIIADEMSDVLRRSFQLDSYWWPTDAYIIALCPQILTCSQWNSKRSDSFIPSFVPPYSDFALAQNLVDILETLFRYIINNGSVDCEEIENVFSKIEALANDPTNHCWMILPLPEHRDRHQQTDWNYNGLRQGAAVSDRSGVFTTCTILSTLYYIRDNVLINRL